MDKNSKGFKLIQTRLREVISESGLTLKELSEKSGVSVYSLKKYLESDVLPTANKYFSLCLALNVSVDYLIGRSDKKYLHEKP